MAKHVFKRSQGVPDKRLVHPKREWAMGLLLFSVIVVVGSVVSTQLFIQYRTVDTKAGEVKESIPQYNDRLVKSVLTTFTERVTAFELLVNDVSAVPASVATSTASTTELGIDNELPEEVEIEAATSSVSLNF